MLKGLLEGTEVETKIGNVGRAAVDVTPDLKVKLSVSVEFDLVAEAKKLAAKTGTPIDDAAISWLESLVKRPTEKVA